MEKIRREIFFNDPKSIKHDMNTGRMGSCVCMIESVTMPKSLVNNFEKIAIWLSNAKSTETICAKNGTHHVTMALNRFMFVKYGTNYTYDARLDERFFDWENYGSESILCKWYETDGTEHNFPSDCGIRIKLCFSKKSPNCNNVFDNEKLPIVNNQYTEELQFNNFSFCENSPITCNRLTKEQQFNIRINELIATDRFSEEIFTFGTHICNVNIIDFGLNEKDTTFSYETSAPACGLMYLVNAHYISNFSNTFSFAGTRTMANDYAICYNHHRICDIFFEEIVDNFTTSIFFEIYKSTDLIRHLQILNEFKSEYEYQIEVGTGNNYLKLGTFNTKHSQNIILEKYLNVLGNEHNMNRPNIKIIVDSSKKSDWKQLHCSVGEIFLDTQFRRDIARSNFLFIKKK